MERINQELFARRERLIRLQSVQNDVALNLPPSIPLPDGEEIPYGSATRLKIRDREQEQEIFQKCIRPPPNKTVFDREFIPFRSNSAELFASSWSDKSSGANLVAQCHGAGNPPSKRSPDSTGRIFRSWSGRRCFFSTEEESHTHCVPSVTAPTRRCHRLSTFLDGAGSSLTSFPIVRCLVHADRFASMDQRQVFDIRPSERPRFRSACQPSSETHARDCKIGKE